MKKEMGTVPAVLITLVVLTAAWIGFDAFFGLVGAVYGFLDQYIWAFFAGIIAFFLSISIVGMMVQITFIVVIAVLASLGGIVALFKGK